MYSLRKWFYRPKKEDTSKLAMFYWADEELTMVATELDSFDGRTDPDRCSVLVTQLRLCQDKVLSICNEIMDEAIPDMRANRDFRAKFPDDVLHENLAGQLWFGAECLAAGSNIIHRELESASMRPLAKALTRALDNVRCLLRAQSLKNSQDYTEKVREALRIFDRLFAEFELSYVSAMVPIKSAKEYHLQQEIVVLFSETLIRGLGLGLMEQEMVDDYDPSLMFTIPRLAIVWGLLIFSEGPFNIDRDPEDISELFRPFCSLLSKIRDLLWTLTRAELCNLEKMLCSQEEPKIEESSCNTKEGKGGKTKDPFDSTEDYINKFCLNHSNCKQFVQDFYMYNFGTQFDDDCNNDVEVPADVPFPSKNSSSKANLEMRNIQNRQGYTLLSTSQEDHFDRLVPHCLDSSECGLPVFSDATPSQNSDNSHLMPKDFNIERKHSSHECICRNVQSELTRSCEESSSCDTAEKYKGCSFFASEVGPSSSSPVSAASLESRLNQLHSNCSCSARSPLRGRSPSRTLMRQVMSRVEIVPAGHHGYNSSPEGSPRAYHHGLLSQSFPARQEYSDMLQMPEQLHVPRAAIAPSKRHSRFSSQRNHSLRIDCDIPSSRLHCSSPCPVSNSSSCREYSNHCDSVPLAIPSRCMDNKSCDATYSSCSSCQSISSVSSPELHSTSPETSSYNSECQDDEEIALALQAAEIASRNRVRARFKNSKDLLHKLFVCISGIADQLQTNYASDLRNILKSVFDMNCSLNLQSISESESSNTICNSLTADQESPAAENETAEHLQNFADASPTTTSQLNIGAIEVVPEHVYELADDDRADHSSVDSAEEAMPDSPPSTLVITDIGEDNESPNSEYGPPAWIPDDMSSHCMACEVPFTLLRRRHHCRNCGKIFCSRCSSNSIPLPRFGHLKPVRVCNQCFMYQLTSLVIQQQQQQQQQQSS